jgi:hypothetical protein
LPNKPTVVAHQMFFQIVDLDAALFARSHFNIVTASRKRMVLFVLWKMCHKDSN